VIKEKHNVHSVLSYKALKSSKCRQKQTFKSQKELLPWAGKLQALVLSPFWTILRQTSAQKKTVSAQKEHRTLAALKDTCVTPVRPGYSP
jgi:hypothetical protein